MSSNPAFSRNPAFQPKQLSRTELEALYGPNATATAQASTREPDIEQTYNMPSATSAETGRMTVEDTVGKTILLFAVMLVSAAVGWMFASIEVVIIGSLAGLVLGLVNSFKKVPSPGLILAYSVAEGLALGSISNFFNAMWDGIVTQAVIGTVAVIGITLFLFLSGKFRTSARMTKIVTVAIIGYMVYQVVNFVLMATGVTGDATFGLSSMSIMGVPLGAAIGIVVVFLAAYSLVMDFESVQYGAKNGAPAVYAWQGAFGILVTVVWLYVEILRLLAILRGND
ncbi:MAG: hypothetical protein RLZZ319_289 [Actinomycetota bacterium]|jgi:uncharacterized YccA/Bax inhibitor family protein